MANLIPTSTLNPLVIGEVVAGFTNMVGEIAKYKRAIAELEVQREQMRHQAQIAMRQIDAQLHAELKRIDALSHGFKKMLKQNQQLIESAKCNREQIMQALQQVLSLLVKCQDLQQSQMLSQLYSTTMESLNQSGQELLQLGQMLHDTHQQFGISVSRRDQGWRDIS